MSITGALNAAMSGLTAAARGAGIVADNIANATTEGYAPRRVELASRGDAGVGGGVQIRALTREADPRLTGERRLAAADAAARSTTAAFRADAAAAVGTPGDGTSLQDRLDAFDAAVLLAEARPESDTRLTAVLHAADDVVAAFARATDRVQDLRAGADRQIAADVATLNDGLAQIDRLNRQILRAAAAGETPLALMDQRAQAIDRLSEVVPLMEVARPNRQVALYTTGGLSLLDAGRPARFGFTAAPVVDAFSRAGVELSGLTVNGRPVSTDPAGPLGDGRLTASFAARDDWGVAAQAALDGLAHRLIARAATPLADPTLGPGAAGLFTDAGAPPDPAGPSPGLAARIGVSPLPDPAEGGALWRLRTGLGAPAPGPVGDPSGLANLRRGLGDGGLSEAASDLLSAFGRDRVQSETARIAATTRAASLREAEAAKGVDTDAELRDLLQIEQLFAANTRVIRAADEMLRRLMEI